ncbi:hypothetical protein VDG1235_1636 [Verrucomicrobiia bacterium DG1235]|nr:hypothetical protein VDG1235_1636 [Verrucomicrobiae bacterium DG1235]
MLSSNIEAANKKPKAEPMKIIKASETQFKHAKLVQTKKVKKKKFLWFKKKKTKLIEPETIPLASQLAVSKVQKQEIENPAADELIVPVTKALPNREAEVESSGGLLVRPQILDTDTKVRVVEESASAEEAEE